MSVKNGQGPKTSILVFEKGGKTDWVWFYKVTNDGYTMGTNRKEQKGNQLVECLTLWHECVKHGKQPKETKNQFCIPAEWIKTLDPRVKEKIRTEIRTDMETKGEQEWKIKSDKLKVKNTEEIKKEKLLFDQMLENRIQNEIAKRIDKAHNYSFNLSNYKSALSESQITEWTEALSHIEPNGATTLDEIHRKLRNSKPENILPFLTKLNPINALEADIAREYVSNIDENIIGEHKEIYTIKKILKSGAKYPIVKLKEYLILNENKIKPNKNPDVNYKVLGVSNETGVFLNEKLQAEETNQSYFVVAKNEFCYNPYRINVGSIGLNVFDYDNQIISGAYIVFSCKEDELNPKYLESLFKSRQFLDYVNEKANGGVRMNFKFEDMVAWEIPLPSLNEQAAIVAQIERQKAIIEGADKIDQNFEIPDSFFQHDFKQELGKICDVRDGTHDSPQQLNQGIPFITSKNLNHGKLDLSNVTYISQNDYELISKRSKVDNGDILFGMIGTIGNPVIVETDFEFGIKNVALIKFYKESAIHNKYLFYYLMSNGIKKYFITECLGGVQKYISLGFIRDLNIPLPDINIQLQIVSELDTQMQILDGLRKMRTEAEKKINQILADVWGVKYAEPVKAEVEE